MSAQLPQQRLKVPPEVDQKEFFTDNEGNPTLVNHADLEAAVPNKEKPYLTEKQRYWVNKPYSFVVIYNNNRHNEMRYYAVEPRLSPGEQRMVDFFRDKLRTTLDYSNIDVTAGKEYRRDVIKEETINLMKRYNLLEPSAELDSSSIYERIKGGALSTLGNMLDVGSEEMEEVKEDMPTPAVQSGEGVESLNQPQVRRILYYLIRDFIRFGRIDPIKNDVNIEDISCDGYYSLVFVYHTQYGEQLVTNIKFGEGDLDNFIKTMAQNAGKGISRRQPNIDATLQDGSRAQLTLGKEITDSGSNFTIRQFNEIPFTPVDLINWQTFTIDQMVYLWLAIENNHSIVFAGGTASGKTTSLNAVSLFMPSTAKIVSIEDTRELEIPQSNWVPNMTRDSFQSGEGGQGVIDEFDLIEDALRKRPDYVIMGEVRGEEGQDLFQLLNTGHTTYTTFHANDPDEVIRRFINEPINVKPAMFDALDIISVQSSVDLGGHTVRRNMGIVEIGDYSSDQGEFPLTETYEWERSSDRQRRNAESTVMEEIQYTNNWSDTELRRELNRRRIVFAYLIKEGINSYSNVAATIQAYMTSPDTVLGLIADGELKERLLTLQKMKTINIDVDPEKEALIPRPTPPKSIQEEAEKILEEGESLLVSYDSEEVDFAATIEDLIDDTDMDHLDEEEAIEQLTAGISNLPLPEGAEPSDISTGSDVANVEIDDELEDLFEDEDEDGEQLLITSDTLNQLNDEGDGGEPSVSESEIESGEDAVRVTESGDEEPEDGRSETDEQTENDIQSDDIDLTETDEISGDGNENEDGDLSGEKIEEEIEDLFSGGGSVTDGDDDEDSNVTHTLDVDELTDESEQEDSSESEIDEDDVVIAPNPEDENTEGDDNEDGDEAGFDWGHEEDDLEDDN